jgi:hypothetical protein
MFARVPRDALFFHAALLFDGDVDVDETQFSVRLTSVSGVFRCGVAVHVSWARDTLE